MQLVELLSITDATLIDELTKDQLSELQQALSLLGYPVGEIDGLIGPKTRNAWAEFKTDVFQGNPTLIGPGSIGSLKDLLSEMGEIKPTNDLSSKQGTIEGIKNECKAQGIGLNTQIAYVLATAQWETAQTFQPVREAFFLGSKAEAYRKTLKYYPYYGRGYVQLTWKTNYERYGKLLKKDLVNNPDLVMDPNLSLFILVHGFKTGAFTGRKITDYINSSQTDFLKARRCINGNDRAKEIKDLAEDFLKSF